MATQAYEAESDWSQLYIDGEWVVDEMVEPKWISVQHEDRDYDLLE